LIRKPVNELHFIQTRDPMSTVEIDLDSLPDGSSGYAQMVVAALAPLAASDSGLRATVYVYQGPSVNFGNYGYSAFFGAAGDRRVLVALYAFFCGAAGLKVRHSDQIRQSQAVCQYHLEDGRLWSPEEEHVWYASIREEEREASEDGFDEGEIDDETWPDEESDPDDTATKERSEGSEDPTLRISSARSEMPARFRAARSDASVGSISRSIEMVFGLPEGAVALRGPDRKVLRSDATIRTLRKRWK